MNRLAATALLCAIALPMSAQTKLLVARSRVHVSVADDYRGDIAYPTSCDDQGRLYVKLVMAGSGMVGPLFRLSSKGAMEAEFRTTGALINRYAVRPDGGVIMMHFDESGKFIDNFAPEGTRESSVALERPPIPFFPSQLAVFPTGEILISGLRYHPGYKASTAIYDPTGKFVRQLALDGDLEIEHVLDVSDTKAADAQQQNTSAIDKSVAITADDGLVYLMRATSPAAVYAISAAGQVVRKIAVSAPSGTELPKFGIRVAKNRVAVQFNRNCGDSTGSCGSSAYTIADATTGKKLATYETIKETAGPIACYAPDPDRFLIFSTLSGHGVDIVEAEPK